MYFFNKLSSAWWPQTTTALCVEDFHVMEVETSSVAVEEVKLVSDVLSAIFSNVDWPSLRAVRCVSKEWNGVATLIMEAKKRLIYDTVACSPDFWAMHTGKEVTAEERERALSMLPFNVEEILYSPCPVFRGKLVKNTHDLVYIKKEFTFTFLGELVERKRGIKAFQNIWHEIIRELDQPVDEEYWVLMTNDVLGGENLGSEGSRGKSYDVQQKMVRQLAERSKKHYEVPKALEAVAVVIARLLKTGEYIFPQGSLWTFTLCQEQSDGFKLSVGGFGSMGFHIGRCREEDVGGVAALRKFS